ncbi:hydroxymethylglutaryl-CoA lyase [Pseudonocardia spinosispora]|uniref:hydroxymethylglutaryl-CoA lyase n=1 Tax=Pseudonocardia spinosispora TaxID=103441 RepID=UPI00041597B2|nr:hydroxymethylglutaryl-CoA lyase [Pseudonocardia spinosispora]
MEPDVLITDVLLRDGLQLEKVVLPVEERLALAEGLLDAGLVSLEVGAFVNPAKVPQMAGSAEVLRGLNPAEVTAQLHTLVFTDGGARRAIEAGARTVRFVVSASDGHSVANAGASTDAALDRLEPAAATLRDAGVRVEGAVATAFVCPFDGDTDPARVARVATRLVGMGAEVVHLADTIGAAHPGGVTRAIGAVRDAAGDIELGLHLHNTYGMAAANAWCALGLGIRRFDAALGGLGGCPFAPGASGNVATDDLVHLLHREGLRTGIDPVKLTAVRDHLAGLIDHPLDSALATVGTAPAAPVTRRRDGNPV